MSPARGGHGVLAGGGGVRRYLSPPPTKKVHSGPYICTPGSKFQSDSSFRLFRRSRSRMSFSLFENTAVEHLDFGVAEMTGQFVLLFVDEETEGRQRLEAIEASTAGELCAEASRQLRLRSDTSFEYWDVNFNEWVDFEPKLVGMPTSAKIRVPARRDEKRRRIEAQHRV
jgi:hypothetical protein